MSKVIKEFLDSNGKLIMNFKNQQELQSQKSKVRNAMRNTLNDEDFDELDMYYQTLKHLEYNF